MKRKKHIVLKSILSVLLVLLIVCGVFAAANWELVKGAFHLLKTAPGNNIKAAWIFLTGDSEKIQRQIGDNDAHYSEAVKRVAQELGEDGLDLSQYTLDKLSSGEYSEEEMVRILLGKDKTDPDGTAQEDTTKSDTQPTDTKTEPNGEDAPNLPDKKDEPKNDDKAAETNNPVPNVPDDSKANDSPNQSDGTKDNADTTVSTDTSSEEVAKCIAKLYVIKSQFTGQLTALEQTMKKTYEDLPEEQRVPESRKSIGRQYISQIADMELECDADVEAALSELTNTLTAQGKDTSVVQTLREAYENEKSLKKAYYLDVYMNGI